MFVLYPYHRVMLIIVLLMFVIGTNIGAANRNATDRDNGNSTPRETIARIAAVMSTSRC